jgi:hypothetical protein
MTVDGYELGLNRTPGPTALALSASKNMTPAFSRARCTASTLAAELRPGPTALSIRTMVGSDTPDAFAKAGWLQPNNARAALICAAVSIS